MFKKPATRTRLICGPDRHPPARRRLALGGAVFLLFSSALSLYTTGAEPASPTPSATLDETRLALSKWIETQQIITKERKEWQQGKEILASRVELVQKEIDDLEAQIKKDEEKVAEARKKRDDLQKENDDVGAIREQLRDAVTSMEADVRRLNKQLPSAVQEKLQPLLVRIPVDAGAAARVAVAERFQNVVGILNAVNQANNEITVNYEVHEGADVPTMYIGLAQAYYTNAATGAAGMGHPTPDGWQWDSSKGISRDILKSMEIRQGKQTAAFVPLPMKIQ